ncbi:MAG TPA: hypothetical protein VGA32_04645, partial [Anaerolineales bacterium]
MDDDARLGDGGSDVGDATKDLAFSDDVGDLLFVVDPVLQRQDRGAVVHQGETEARGRLRIVG